MAVSEPQTYNLGILSMRCYSHFAGFPHLPLIVAAERWEDQEHNPFYI